MGFTNFCPIGQSLCPTPNDESENWSHKLNPIGMTKRKLDEIEAIGLMLQREGQPPPIYLDDPLPVLPNIGNTGAAKWAKKGIHCVADFLAVGALPTSVGMRDTTFQKAKEAAQEAHIWGKLHADDTMSLRQRLPALLPTGAALQRDAPVPDTTAHVPAVHVQAPRMLPGQLSLLRRRTVAV